METVAPPQQSQGVAEDTVPLFKKRSAKSKSALRKRPATPPPAASASDSSDYSDGEDDSGRQIKRRRKQTGVEASSAQTITDKPSDSLSATTFAADRSATISSINDATKQSNWFDEQKPEASLSTKALLGTTRSKAPSDAAAAAASSNNNGNSTYKGAAGYQSFIQKNPDAPSRQLGPVKAPTNIRTITVTDFAPDVCKDYKQTGFCGFGDSCKFLHAREDYKQGWELDREWEVGTKGKKLRGQTVASANRAAKAGGVGDEDEGDDAALENIPFACIICKKAYVNPVVTKCGHYFCEACALLRYRKNPSCAACGAGTGGVFNGAKNLKKLLDKKRERARLRDEKEGEENSTSSDNEEDS